MAKGTEAAAMNIWFKIFVVVASSFFCGITFLLKDDDKIILRKQNNQYYGLSEPQYLRENPDELIIMSCLYGLIMGALLGIVAFCLNHYYNVPWILVYYAVALYCFFVIDFRRPGRN